MRNLLSAHLFRLGRSRLFLGCLLVMSSFGALLAFNYYEMSQTEPIALDGAFFSYPIPACIAAAVFVPLFFGAEHSGHAIRNKVAAGYSRPHIYAANLLAGVSAAVLFCAAYLAAVLAVGVPMVGPIAMSWEQAALLLLGSLAAVAAVCALLTLVAANCERTSVSAAACVLGVFLLLFASIYIRSRLLAPEYLNGSWNAAGEYVPGLPTPNPQYLGGPQRAVFEVLNVFLPTCQIVQYASQQGQDAGWMALWALAVSALSTGAGIALFRRKNLR